MTVLIVNELRPWIRQAACVGLDPEIFFPVPLGSRPVGARKVARKAFAVCATCAVTEECFAWALETGERDGVYGGRLLRTGHVVKVANFVQVHINASSWSSRMPQE